MINISDTYKQNIINKLMNTRLEIVFPDGEFATITEENVASESMKLKQSICDESTLKFGGCIASEFDINIINSVDRTFDQSLVGKWISVRLIQTFPSGAKLYPSATLYPGQKLYPGETNAEHIWYVFSGRIDSANVDKSDRNMRNIVAYDAFAELHQADGTSLLMSVLKSHQDGYNWLRNVLLIVMQSENINYDYANWCSFMDEVTNVSENRHVYNYQILNDSWINDNNTISKCEIIRCICEMMGLFGAIKPDNGKGTFMLIALGNTAEQYDFYENLYAEEYQSIGYNDFMLLKGNKSRTDKVMHHILPDTADYEKVYDLTENACCWQSWDGAGLSEDSPMINLINSSCGYRMYNSEFTPLSATVDGRLWVEVGDKINLKTYKTDVNGDYVFDSDGNIVTETVTSYVLSRTISGIHALTDKIEAKGAYNK